MSVIRIDSGSFTSNVYYEYDPSATPLGCGGMGRVFKGRSFDKKSGITRDVAIKCLYEDLPDHVIARARREASIRLRNDSLIEMIDFIECDGDGSNGSTQKTYYVVSEYIDGVSLDEFLDGKLKNKDGVVSAEIESLYALYKKDSCDFAIKVVNKVLAGMMALHDANYVHRDIDPSNIMIDTHGGIKLIDFGIAKKISTINTGDKQYTVNGQIIGKPFYAAPELVTGDVKNHNSTTDTYAIGILLFHLITGHVPFKGAIHEVIDKQLHSNVPLKEIQNRAVRAIIEKATNKRQTLRYRSAAEFRVALESVDLSRGNGGGRGAKVAIACIAVLAIVGGAAFFLMKPDEKSAEDGEDTKGQINVVALEKDTTSTAGTIPSPTPHKESDTYSSAVKMLKSPDSVEVRNGFKAIQELADAGDNEAMLLRSRIYYQKAKSDVDLLDFGVVIEDIRKVLGIVADKKKAHNYLVEYVKDNEDDYRAWFELGCDYYAGPQRGVDRRDMSFAKYCFLHADTLLSNVGGEISKQYREEIDIKLVQIDKRRIYEPKWPKELAN
ncbi:MAG: serine/threonine protein kinase [Alistipes sp.]|nr:serine/threonine protein kinase [Alistipes sp.]